MNSTNPMPEPSRFVAALYVLAFYGVWMTLLTPPTLSLALRAAQIAPENKEALLSAVLGFGAVVAMIANPLAGLLSDRTTGRFGLRRPWILGGLLFSFVGLYLMGTGGRFNLVVGWCVTQAALNATLATITAVLPDQFPEDRRGTVSGFLGVAPLVGTLGGAYIATLVGNSISTLFLMPAVVTLPLVIAFCWVLRDRQSATEARPAGSFKDMVKGFAISPHLNPDFYWAFASRFLLFMGLATLLTYQVFLLTDSLRLASSEIPHAMFASSVVTAMSAVLGSVVSGWLSDKLQRRKIFVLLSALVYALGLLCVGLAENFHSFLVGIGVAGLGQGIYFAVDLALVADILPDKEGAAAKDLGLFQLANAVPQTVAPAIAPIFLTIGTSGGSGNYTALFIAAAIFAALGAAAITPIRRVR